MRNLFALIFFSTLLVSCGDNDRVILADPDITKETFMQSHLEYTHSDLSYQYESVDQLDLKTMNTRQKFVCAVNKSSSSINKIIRFERAYYKKLFPKIKSDTLTQAEELWLVKTLMKYRLIDSNKYFYPATKYTSKQIDERLTADAKKYQSKFGIPSMCSYKYHKDSSTVSEPIESSECLAEFLRRAQVIAPALIASQAAIESGWGESRFAKAGNNLFGLQFIFRSSAELKERPYCVASLSNPKHCSYKFVDISDGIKEYYRFINAGTYQPEFRHNRGSAEIRNDGCMTAEKMATGQTNYAENENYIEDILLTMKSVCRMVEKCKV